MKKIKGEELENTYLEIANNHLAELFEEIGIRHFYFTALGNSISSGYRIGNAETKPLLFRNDSLYQVMKDKSIELIVHHFARAANNSDARTYEMFENNTRISQVYDANRQDYTGLKHLPASLPATIITNENKNLYYPTNVENDIGLSDLLSIKGTDVSNMVVYNGATGEFLDNYSRGGNPFHPIRPVKQDCVSIEKTVGKLLVMNRQHKTNTQIYLCGVPNILGIHVISEIINVRLKDIAKRYPHVVYVEPAISKGITEKGRDVRWDVHHTDLEYLQLNRNIIKTIRDHYLITREMIEVDREFYRLSNQRELSDLNMANAFAYDFFLDSYYSCESSKNATWIKLQFLKKVISYLSTRMPSDFFYLEDTINKIKKMTI